MALMPQVDSLAMVVALRLLQGVGEAAFFVAGFALLADLAPPERMGEALSYNSLGLYLGLAFGPPLGELLLESGGFEPPGTARPGSPSSRRCWWSCCRSRTQRRGRRGGARAAVPPAGDPATPSASSARCWR